MRANVETLLERSRVHAEWRPLVAAALAQVDPDYLADLTADHRWLPGIDRLLAAFQRDFAGLRYLLIGESPYPRAESANGIAFYDAAVGDLWSANGLSKAVNRATSLRNLIKAALIAEGRVQPDANGKISQAAIAAIDKKDLVRTLADLFSNFERAGCLLLNATLVLHPERKPAVEARYWHGFLACLLASIVDQCTTRPTLVLWGKIAQLVQAIPASQKYVQLQSEHPYNLSFIDHPVMRRLFGELSLLQRRFS